MESQLKFAAIDIGSNAIRLLFTNVIEKNGESHLKKSSLIRVPIRLGADTFTRQLISSEKEEKMVNTKDLGYLCKPFLGTCIMP